jgi:hypothetical protein
LAVVGESRLLAFIESRRQVTIRLRLQSPVHILDFVEWPEQREPSMRNLWDGDIIRNRPGKPPRNANRIVGLSRVDSDKSGEGGIRTLVEKPAKTVLFSERGAESGAGAAIDPDLASLIHLWPDLPEAIRAEIVAIARGGGRRETQ